ncbi:hypothetical protein MAPG_04171 [Magnaporthiopsis poae ATCC 64411]|uniref:Uncharacterized protein n=1 Tax=Magnaporthiopsis poae (strain ATCC 64411 / 73-15) TaxID=644358 RepID=A0A0C4DW03_MAGP6|nr:hypothetical protein MAPG_04171 [Magnaporthiopsis poae ATCC 64411]
MRANSAFGIPVLVDPGLKSRRAYTGGWSASSSTKEPHIHPSTFLFSQCLTPRSSQRKWGKAKMDEEAKAQGVPCRDHEDVRIPMPHYCMQPTSQGNQTRPSSMHHANDNCWLSRLSRTNKPMQFR